MKIFSLNKKHKLSLLLFFILSLTLISCSNNTDRKNFRLGHDGLIYYANSHDLFTGTIVDTNLVIIKFTVINGIKYGTFSTHYLNGRLEKSGVIINNKNEGIWEYYYKNGQLESKGNFTNDSPNGPWESYYKNGNISSAGNYVNGKMQGIWSFYDIDGELINQFYYRNGILIEVKIRNA